MVWVYFKVGDVAVVAPACAILDSDAIAVVRIVISIISIQISWFPGWKRTPAADKR